MTHFCSTLALPPPNTNHLIHVQSCCLKPVNQLHVGSPALYPRVLCAPLSSDSLLHFTHQIRSEGWRSVPGPTSPLYIPVALILGGLPRVCPSSLSTPLLHLILSTHTHTAAATSLLVSSPSSEEFSSSGQCFISSQATCLIA